jgi:predicted kinase
MEGTRVPRGASRLCRESPSTPLDRRARVLLFNANGNHVFGSPFVVLAPTAPSAVLGTRALRIGADSRPAMLGTRARPPARSSVAYDKQAIVCVKPFPVDTMSSPIIYLICGSTGAGKTTYAVQLSEKAGAVRFSIDEWMAALFWMDSPMPIESSWAMERVGRCYNHIWAVALQVAKRGVPCVLDLGFGQQNERIKFAQLARGAGFSVELHFLDVPASERWRRVQARNANKAATHQLPFEVTRDMFDFVESIWDSPTDAEMSSLNGILVSGPDSFLNRD